MTAHGHNPILDLYGTPRQGHAATFQSGRPSKERQVDHQLDLPQRPRADKPVAMALSRTFQRGCLFPRSPPKPRPLSMAFSFRGKALSLDLHQGQMRSRWDNGR